MSKNLCPTIPTTLLGAAELLRVRGWITGQTEAPDGRMCLVGAIQRFVDDQGIDDPVVSDNLKTDAINQLTRAIWELPSGAEKPHPTAWNDRHCKTADVAIAMLERAAEVVP